MTKNCRKKTDIDNFLLDNEKNKVVFVGLYWHDNCSYINVVLLIFHGKESRYESGIA